MIQTSGTGLSRSVGSWLSLLGQCQVARDLDAQEPALPEAAARANGPIAEMSQLICLWVSGGSTPGCSPLHYLLHRRGQPDLSSVWLHILGELPQPWDGSYRCRLLRCSEKRGFCHSPPRTVDYLDTAPWFRHPMPGTPVRCPRIGRGRKAWLLSLKDVRGTWP